MPNTIIQGDYDKPWNDKVNELNNFVASFESSKNITDLSNRLFMRMETGRQEITPRHDEFDASGNSIGSVDASTTLEKRELFQGLGKDSVHNAFVKLAQAILIFDVSDIRQHDTYINDLNRLLSAEVLDANSISLDSFEMNADTTKLFAEVFLRYDYEHRAKLNLSSFSRLINGVLNHYPQALTEDVLFNEKFQEMLVKAQGNVETKIDFSLLLTNPNNDFFKNISRHGLKTLQEPIFGLDLKALNEATVNQVLKGRSTREWKQRLSLLSDDLVLELLKKQEITPDLQKVVLENASTKVKVNFLNKVVNQYFNNLGLIRDANHNNDSSEAELAETFKLVGLIGICKLSPLNLTDTDKGCLSAEGQKLLTNIFAAIPESDRHQLLLKLITEQVNAPNVQQKGKMPAIFRFFGGSMQADGIDDMQEILESKDNNSNKIKSLIGVINTKNATAPKPEDRDSGVHIAYRVIHDMLKIAQDNAPEAQPAPRLS